MIIRKITPEWIELGVPIMDDFSSSVICKPSILQAEYGGDKSMPKCFHSFIHYFLWYLIRNGERKTDKEILIGILLLK